MMMTTTPVDEKEEKHIIASDVYAPQDIDANENEMGNDIRWKNGAKNWQKL